MPRVSVTFENHIAHVELTRPDKMNAVDNDMIDAIIAAGQEVASSAARAVVLSGQGKAFCAGTDTSMFTTDRGNPIDRLVPRSHGNTNKYQEVAMIWRRVPVPVIAALHGVAFGAGFQLALGADIRIAAPDTRLAIMEMKWGLVPDMGGMVLLPQLARSDVIRRLTYSAEPIIAKQAERWGLVTEVAENPLRVAQDMAAAIALRSPSAVRAAKRLIALAETAEEDEVLMAESEEQAALAGGADQMEVIAAQMQGRPPKFK